MYILPRLDVNSLETSSFLDSFSGLIEEELVDHGKGADTSYDIQRFTDIKGFDPEWDDEDVDEILVICPKTVRTLPTIEEEPVKVDNLKKQTTTLADFEPLPTGAESSQQPRLYRKRNTGRIYAFRTFPDCGKPPLEQDILNTIKDLKAPFLPRIHWSFQEDHCHFVVMEYYFRKSLKDLVTSEGPLKGDHARFYATELVEAISSLHTAGIVHRGLSPENITIDTAGHIVVEGFSASELLQYPGKRDQGSEPLFCTTPVNGSSTFLAPELILGWAHDFSVDAWGFGLLLRFMLSGKHLFNGDSILPLVWRDSIVHDPAPNHPLIETSAQDLITKCLQRNPIVRLSLLAIRKHPYFSATDWKKVAAKRIRVPHCLDPTNAGNPTRLGFRTSNSVSHLPEISGQHSRKSHLGRSVLVASTASSDDSAMPPVLKLVQSLPQILRMSSLLDDISATTESMTSLSDLPVHSALTLNDCPRNTPPDISPRDRMALFWESLDAEVASVLSDQSIEDVYTPRPRRLRKSRSSIYPGQRFSTPSTTSLQNKLRKKTRPSNPVPVQLKNLSSTALDLPEGVEQIGSGIGFIYSMPAATLSKASICTTTPKTCHGYFQGRFPGLGLRSANTVAKAKARRSLLNLVIPPAQEDICDATFTRDFRGSSWSLSTPLTPDLLHDDPATASSSPSTEAGPLTPATLVYEEPMIGELGFEESSAHEVKVGDVDVTLRLVSSQEA